MRSSTSLLVFALLLATASGHAQQIRGTVNDVTTGQPLEGTLLVVLDADSTILATTLSDPSGAFVLRAPPKDSIRLRVQHFGYAPQRSVPILLEQADTLQLVVGLRPEAVAVGGITVTAPVNRNLERFLRDQRMGFGKYLGPEEIARINPQSTSHLLLGMTGSPVQLSRSGRRIVTRTRGGGGGSGLPPGTCVPRVYVDGALVEEEHKPRESAGGSPFLSSPVRERGIAVESLVPAKSVRAVAVYQNPAQAPAEFQRSFMEDCPVVVIWTNYGFGFGKAR